MMESLPVYEGDRVHYLAPSVKLSTLDVCFWHVFLVSSSESSCVSSLHCAYTFTHSCQTLLTCSTSRTLQAPSSFPMLCWAREIPPSSIKLIMKTSSAEQRKLESLEVVERWKKIGGSCEPSANKKHMQPWGREIVEVVQVEHDDTDKAEPWKPGIPQVAKAMLSRQFELLIRWFYFRIFFLCSFSTLCVT